MNLSKQFVPQTRITKAKRLCFTTSSLNPAIMTIDDKADLKIREKAQARAKLAASVEKTARDTKTPDEINVEFESRPVV